VESKTAKRKEREREARRESILDAAGRVFAMKGFHAATLDEIADQAELGKGTLYNYYDDKQDIFVSLVERAYDEVQARVDKVVDEATGLTDFVSRLLDMSVELLTKHQYLFKTLAAGAELAAPVRIEILNALHGHFARAESQVAEALGKFITPAPSGDELLVGARLCHAAMRHFTMVHMLSGADFGAPEKELLVKMLARALQRE
jgi:AcrR family transcriptional regulator